MVSFRFFFVSIIAVFLALGIGIAVGATVVNEATVKLITERLDSVRERADRTDKANDDLRTELARWDRFGEQGGDGLVKDRLAGTEVVLAAVRGIDRAPVDRLRQSLLVSGANVDGTLWFTSKLQLADPKDVATLSTLLDVPSTSPSVLRRNLVGQLARVWAAGGPSPLVEALRSGGFVDIEATPGGEDIRDGSLVTTAAARFVVISDAEADVPNDEMAVPFATELAGTAPGRVLAVEATAPAPAESTPEVQPPFVAGIRGDETASAALSTVDNLGDFRGRVAAVLALAQLGQGGKVGHYGVGPGASRLVPEPPR